ncbi:VOC family protein, partial [Enterococcus faecium]|uniref:VOC family protein n=1 Tax=Enterococcus faecium TaxID=1352 RepID=UPI000C01FFC0
MNSMVFVNFPVADVNRSVAFYEKLGFKKNEEFSTEEAGSMVWDGLLYLSDSPLQRAGCARGGGRIAEQKTEQDKWLR